MTDPEKPPLRDGRQILRDAIEEHQVWTRDTQAFDRRLREAQERERARAAARSWWRRMLDWVRGQ